jgi:16S rRNA (guanine966-N2)-methyltransferase
MSGFLAARACLPHARFFTFTAMRIIAGELRGRRIAVPDGEGTRPLLSRVRQALFSTLGDLVPDAKVLDLFAGTGSLGLEALSQGASEAHFVEVDRAALELLRANIEELEVGDRARIVRGDALDPRSWRAPGGGQSPWADLVFLDPPYPDLRERSQRAALFEAISKLHADVLRTGGALVLHTQLRAADAAEFPRGIDLERRAYGNTALWYLWKPSSLAGETAEEAG